MKRTGQAGIISLVAAMLLVTGVLVVILLTTGIIQSRGADTARTSDSTAAFALAESGLERAQTVISNAVTSAIASDSTCTGFLTAGPFSIGRGTLSYPSATSSPASCGTTTACTGCVLTARGVVGSTERDLTLDVEYGTQYGVTGRGKTVSMALKNTFNTDAIALFNLAWRRQGQGGNASSTLTTCSTCTLMWNLNSSSGQKSAGGMGTAVPITALTYSQIVTQTLDYSRDFTEVGGLFPGVSSAPTKLAAYWSDGTEGAGASYSTFSNNGTTTTGKVLAGAATSSLSSCVTPTGSNGMNPPGNNGDYQSQSCTSWCYGGDTLIMGLSAGSKSVADQTTAASFDSSGNNISMSKLVHYPNTDGTTANASGAEYAEIWYLYNPPWNSTSDPVSGFSGAGATSYTAAAVGSSGSTLTFQTTGNPKFSNGKNAGTITSVTGGKACVGDVMSNANFPVGTTIFSLNGSTSTSTCVSAGSSGASIVSSQNATGNVSSATVADSTFVASGVTGSISVGTATLVATNTTISITQVISSTSYKISPTMTISSGYIVQGSANSSVIKVNASDLPSAVTWTDASGNSHNTFVRLYSTGSGGAGVLAANTTITNIDTTNNTFTISPAATTPLVGATVCAGTCAFFNTPSSASTVTSFSITPSANTTQWSIGFMCMKNVDPTKIQAVSTTAITSRNWSEAVQ